jgi:DNA-binding winged helix-turn-helix (wHTH) protein/Tfp pilus assembly protein PilF
MQLAQSSTSVVRFGVFEADLSSGELRKNGVRVKIQELPFRALKLLVSHPNEVLSRDEIRRALWPENVFVDFDRGISSAVNRLRDALGDSADNPIFIETVERRGYRWIAPVHTPRPLIPAKPILVHSGTQSQQPSHQWGWIFVIPIVVVLVAMWRFDPAGRPAKASDGKPARPASASEKPLQSSEAGQFYLKGRFYWQKRTPEGLNKAVDYFTQAIVHDANYAPAYVGLADCYNLMREYTLMPPSEAYPRALAAAQKAVELDDHSSEAHASLAFALYYGNWDVVAADREFRRAIELDPNNAVAHHWYATYLSANRRLAESMAEMDRAQNLDPTSRAILADKGNLLLSTNQREAGIALLKQLEASEPNFVSPPRYLKNAYFDAGDYAGYLSEWKNEANAMHDASTLKMIAQAEKALALDGRTGMLESIRRSEKKSFDQGQFAALGLARTDALLGNKQEALHYLQIGYDHHEEGMTGISGDAAFADLRSDAAYQALITKINTPPHS